MRCYVKTFRETTPHENLMLEYRDVANSVAEYEHTYREPRLWTPPYMIVWIRQHFSRAATEYAVQDRLFSWLCNGMDGGFRTQLFGGAARVLVSPAQQTSYLLFCRVSTPYPIVR
jgi:hypothetical protein